MNGAVKFQNDQKWFISYRYILSLPKSFNTFVWITDWNVTCRSLKNLKKPPCRVYEMSSKDQICEQIVFFSRPVWIILLAFRPGSQIILTGSMFKWKMISKHNIRFGLFPSDNLEYSVRVKWTVFMMLLLCLWILFKLDSSGPHGL